MRKLFLSALLTATLSGVFAQKLEEVQEKISKGKYDEAKEKLDKFFADPKNATNPTGWYYKGKIYAALAQQDSAGVLTYDAQREAFDAFKKYQEMDSKNTLMILDQNVGLFQLYDLYYNQGVKAYNNKDYEKAYNKMKVALELESYINKKGYSYNGFSFPAMDTQLTNLTASSAWLAKKEDESIPYFETLANARLKDKEYREIYGLLAEYYMKKNNEAKANEYIKMGRELHPDNDYWTSLEFGNITDKDKRLARYEQMAQKYPDNYPLMMDYAIEQFNATYSNETKPADYAVRQEKTGKLLAQALALKSTAIGNYVMSQHLYNQVFDMDDKLRAVKGATAADAAKRKEINLKINEKYDELYTYSQKAYDLYTQDASDKAVDKANLRKVINQLIDYHTRKKQMDKVTFYQDKLKNLKM